MERSIWISFTNDLEKARKYAAASGEHLTVRMMLSGLKKTSMLGWTSYSFMSIETTALPLIITTAEKPSMDAGYSAVALVRASSAVMTRSSER